MKIEFTIPMTKNLIVSEANRGGEHWSVKSRRHRMQKFMINAYMSKLLISKDILPCSILMTRIAPRSLDEEDNLRSCFKHIKDYISDFLIPGKGMGQADSDKRIIWQYSQEKGKSKEYAVRIEIKSNEE
jgi:hypothetical protein